MEFTSCQKDIMQYIIDYEHSKVYLTPSIEVFNYVFNDKYTTEIISKECLNLIFAGLIESYGWFKYLKLTDTFKSNKRYYGS